MRKLRRSFSEADRTIGASSLSTRRTASEARSSPELTNLDSKHAEENFTYLTTLGEAASFATQFHGLQIVDSDIEALIALGLLTNLSPEGKSEVRLRSAEIESYGVVPEWAPDAWESEDLLAQVDRRRPIPLKGLKKGTLILTVTTGLRITFPLAAFRPYECQLFLREFRRTSRPPKARPSGTALVIDQIGNVGFQSTSPELICMATDLWRRIAKRAETATETERRITLSIYGVKTRLLPFITCVVQSIAKADAVVCDLMCGSGIVTRKFAATHDVFANDANPYGATLVAAATGTLSTIKFAQLVDRLKLRIAENVQALEKIFQPYLKREMELFHSACTAESMEKYLQFCAEVPSYFGRDSRRASNDENCLHDIILRRRLGPRAFPYILASAYWANVHFGLRQAILLDSIRYAAELETGPTREIALAALLQAALLCASGPHFAQPFRPNGLSQYKALIDKRSKRIDGEFFNVLTEYKSLPIPAYRLLATTTENWRTAIQKFSRMLGKRPGLVYVDPPYTQVQYSRYYHVLNVLIAYDYPVCAGPGRCPERGYRFSSRFEFKPGAAKRELFDLIAECSLAGMDLVISYSRSGAITISDIVTKLGEHYSNLEIFQANIRHHTQGRAAPRGRLETIEYVLAASGCTIPK